MEDFVGATLGWLGTAGTFSAYLMIWRGWASPTAIRYASLNAIGGFMAAGGALMYGAWPAVASNLVWGVIGAHGVLCALRSRWARMRLAAPGDPSASLTAASATPAASTADAQQEEPADIPPGAWTPSVTDALAISLPWLDPSRHVEPEDPSAFDTIPISLPWLRAEEAAAADASEAAAEEAEAAEAAASGAAGADPEPTRPHPIPVM
ncbi:hypothetical protein [Leucobacter tenebrionis]|uniref:hypothetical protein n=1 Tax=Leucobacter tenebrionis TaxID=2873270 RepID=UPI001CA60A03|nr:hypothetical protein [Leucobacter tenebrionis]QZY52844.1 hypothetical protein KVY00_05250 [Leucobacter tenebrionis]